MTEFWDDANPEGPRHLSDGLPRHVDVPAVPVRCRCSHGPSVHTGGYGQCWISVCGCSSYRDPQEAPAIPARFDERYDPSPEPIDRSIQ